MADRPLYAASASAGAGGIINIPMRFWFNNDITTLIPEVSMRYANVQISIDFVTYAGACGKLNFDDKAGPGSSARSTYIF